jgi:hypothetical protein
MDLQLADQTTGHHPDNVSLVGRCAFRAALFAIFPKREKLARRPKRTL